MPYVLFASLRLRTTEWRRLPRHYDVLLMPYAADAATPLYSFDSAMPLICCYFTLAPYRCRPPFLFIAAADVDGAFDAAAIMMLLPPC